MKWLLSAIALTLAMPLSAKTLKAVPAKLDPHKAYIVVEYRSRPVTLAGSLRKYYPLQGLIFARYDPSLHDIRGLGRATGNPLQKGISPFEPFENRAIAETDGRRLMLVEMDPDDWVIEGLAGTAFSLGSYGFKLEPGMIVDLGVVSSFEDWPEGEKAPDLGDMLAKALFKPFSPIPVAPSRVEFHTRTASDLPLPVSLSGATTISLVPDQKFGNHRNELVNRIEGVNARLKAQAVPPAPTQ